MSQAKLTEYFNTRKRAADSIDGNISKKLKTVTEDSISQSHVVTRSSTKTIRTTRASRSKLSTKSASKAIRVSTKAVDDIVQKADVVDKVENQNVFSLVECKTKVSKEKSVVAKNLFPEVEKKVSTHVVQEAESSAPMASKFPTIVFGEEKRKALKEELKSSNLTELRQKLLELHGMSPRKQPGLLSPTKSSLMALKSPVKANLTGSPLKPSLMLKKDVFSTPTKSSSPFKQPVREVITSPSKMIQDILSSPTKAAPRVRRELYSSLPSLNLPSSYSSLNNLFSTVDLVVSMLTNRQEICTFDKLKKAVEQMTKRGFTLKHLEQIKHVYPLAYNFRQETGLPCFGQGRTTGYQLTIEANIDEDDLTKPVSPMKSSLKFTPAKITERKALFRSKLVDIVKKYHQEFLKNLAVPLDLGSEKLTQWHPQFSLERLPDVPCSDLPAAPDLGKILDAKDFLHLAPGNMDLRVKKALQTTAETKSTEEDKVVLKAEEKNSIGTAGKLTMKGIPLALLERVKVKEAENLAKMLTVPPEESRKRKMLDNLPELARTLYHAFTTRKRPAISQEETIRALCASPTCFLSPIEMEKHLELMCEVLPEWVTVAKISSGTYIKLMKSVEIGTVLKKLDGLLKA